MLSLKKKLASRQSYLHDEQANLYCFENNLIVLHFQTEVRARKYDINIIGRALY